ncbi:hypothetical protein H6G65_03080 [Microcystis elabens FACHB-917]|nr:hypothetical protein [Microcystis elabens FACHB-917]
MNAQRRQQPHDALSLTGGLGISQRQELAVAGIAAGQGLYTRVNHHF